jgi:hypothetical protein
MSGKTHCNSRRVGSPTGHQLTKASGRLLAPAGHEDCLVAEVVLCQARDLQRDRPAIHLKKSTSDSTISALQRAGNSGKVETLHNNLLTLGLLVQSGLVLNHLTY